MQYPLYEYYKNRDMNLDEIVDHYVTRFYAKKHDGKAVLNVLNKVRDSSKIKNLCGQSATRRLAPNYVDFLNTINEIIWFVFRSNMTQALAALFAALYWDEKINSVYNLKTDEELRDDIIKVFKKLSIYEEMTEDEFIGENKDSIKDDSKDKKIQKECRKPEEQWSEQTIKSISFDQRSTLYFFINQFYAMLFGYGKNDESGKKVAKIISDYQSKLELSEEQAYTIAHNSGLSYNDFYEKMKSITCYPEINRFLYLSVLVLDLKYNKAAIDVFSKILGIVGYSNKDLHLLLKSVEKTPQTHIFDKIQLDCIPPILPQNPEKGWSRETIAKLNEGERFTLYYFAYYFSFLYDKNKYSRRKKEAIQTLTSYQNILGLTDNQVHEISTKWELKFHSCCENLASIHNYPEINRLLYICVQIGDLSYNGKTIETFNKIIEIIGYAKDDLRLLFKKIDSVPHNHFFENEMSLSLIEKGDNHNTKSIGTPDTMQEPQSNGIPIEFLVEDLKENFDYNASFKRHALTYMALRPETSFLCKDEKMATLWAYKDGNLFCDQENASTMGAGAFMWLMQKYQDRETLCWVLDLLNKECSDMWSQGIAKSANELIEDIKQYLPDFKLGNNPEKVKTSLQWTWIDIQSLLVFFRFCTVCSYAVLQDEKVVANLRDCSSMAQLTRLYLSDFNVTGKGVTKEDSTEQTEYDKKRAEYAIKASADFEAEKEAKKTKEISPKQEDIKEPVIVASWSFMDFAHLHGQPKLTQPHEFVNSRTGETFIARTVAFVHPTEKDDKGRNKVIFVGFSSNLGELTAEEIAAQKDKLIVVQYDNGNYGLKQQEDNLTFENVAESDNWENLSTDATKEDLANAWTDEYGAKYSKDGKKLLEVTSSIDDYDVREGTEVICDNAFAKCESLENITLPVSIAQIGSSAFWRCGSLKSIRIPASVKAIGEDVLSECRNLTSIVVDENNRYYDSRNNCNAIIESKSGILIAGCSSTIIPNGVKKISHQAFGGCPIKTIDIPNCVIEIGSSAFCCCEELSSIVIPDSVETIGQLAFCDCKSLTTIEMSQGIKEIGEGVFLFCKQLESIIIPKGTKGEFEQLMPEYKEKLIEQTTNKKESTGIADDWWTDENGIPYIIDFMPNSSNTKEENFDSLLCNNDANSNGKIDKELTDTYIDEYGAKYSSDKKILKRVPKEINDYSILDGTEIIGDAAFSNCKELVSVSIPDSVKEIGHYAFAGCKKMFSFIIPNGVKHIGDGTFMNCETMAALRLPESLLSINDDTFEGCDNLRTIFVPVEEKVRFEIMLSKFNVYVGEYSSDDISALDEFLSGLLDDNGVLYSKDGKKLFTHTKKRSSYTIKEGTEIICGKAFNPINGVDDCLTLKEINLPDTIVSIGEMAFAYNEKLKEISLPSSINFIGKDAFLNCNSLCTILIPSGSRAKFDKLLPELVEKLVEKAPVEKYGDVVDQLTDFELPDGSIYNGNCIKKPFGSIELCGQGEICYPNGDKYNGAFKYGFPFGWGKYIFKNGHTHKGYFDNSPKGLGYLNEDYGMTVGNYYNGKLHGWGICYRNRIFKFGYWEDGKLVKDETNNTLWIRKQISEERYYYRGNLIQIGKECEFIRFGIPSKLLGEREPGIPIEKIPKMPAWGFEFFKDGTVKVGAIRNHDSGEFTIYYPDGTSELGKWKDGVKTSSFTIDRLQNNIDEYEVDGLDVF